MSDSGPDSLRDRLRAAYDGAAQERAKGDTQDWKVTERAAYLAHLRAEGKRSLLELGAGHGRDSKFFQDEGLTVTCVDLSPAMVELCRTQGLDAQVMDMAHLTFADESFDAAYALNSLLHLPKAELPGVLREVRRVLVPGGLFFLGVYGGNNQEGIFEQDSYEPKRFFSFFTDEGIQQAVAQVFEIVTFHTVALVPGDPHHFQSLLLRKSKA